MEDREREPRLPPSLQATSETKGIHGLRLTLAGSFGSPRGCWHFGQIQLFITDRGRGKKSKAKRRLSGPWTSARSVRLEDRPDSTTLPQSLEAGRRFLCHLLSRLAKEQRMFLPVWPTCQPHCRSVSLKNKIKRWHLLLLLFPFLYPDTFLKGKTKYFCSLILQQIFSNLNFIVGHLSLHHIANKINYCLLLEITLCVYCWIGNGCCPGLLSVPSVASQGVCRVKDLVTSFTLSLQGKFTKGQITKNIGWNYCKFVFVTLSFHGPLSLSFCPSHWLSLLILASVIYLLGNVTMLYKDGTLPFSSFLFPSPIFPTNLFHGHSLPLPVVPFLSCHHV